MAKSKDYKASGAKKWLIIFGILVLIAIVVVAVVLLIPANTYSMIEALQENESHFLLKDTKEKNDFNEFTLKIKGSTTLNYYTQEIEDVEIVVNNMSSILSFYNDYMVFANQNKVLSSNTKSINKCISNANNIQKNIDKLLENTKKLEDDSTSYLKNAWIDFRKELNKYIENYYKMFLSLSKCYQGCFNVSYTQNNASTKILNAANDYIYCIMSDYKVIINNDRKDNIVGGGYAYVSAPKINWFNAFVQNCIVDNAEITQYLYTPSLQTSYKKLDEFFKVYKELDFKKMIGAINTAGLNNPYKNVSDPSSTFAAAKKFLDRRG